MHGKMTLILDDRFILHEYTGRMGDKPFQGVAIYGFDLNTNKFQSAWIDSFHMPVGIMFSEGDPDEVFSFGRIRGGFRSGGVGELRSRSLTGTIS